ncbi:MAG: isochorismatase family protein [Actinomycetota bacterium]|nr:MAG: isochorismatase family protein [Actinomycetota bacterium]
MESRVWDPFLTEQDRRTLKERPHLVRGFGQKPALVLIDLYRWVFGDFPQPVLEALDRWPGSCGLAAWEAIPYIQRLLAGARNAQIPVIHVTGLDSSGVEGWSEQGTDLAVPAADPDYMDRLGHRFDIIPEVAPISGEAVLRKTSPSAFWGTPLVGHLNALGVDTLIVCGESTSGCVRATVVDGRTYRYNVIVAEECVFDRHQAPHAINLFDMHQKYADVLALDEILLWMASCGNAPSELEHLRG